MEFKVATDVEAFLKGISYNGNVFQKYLQWMIISELFWLNYLCDCMNMN